VLFLLKSYLGFLKLLLNTCEFLRSPTFRGAYQCGNV